MTLAADIETLATEHKTVAHTDDGLEFHTHPALLDMLREAIFGGMERGGGSSMKARLPISDAALDLYTPIDHQIAEAWSSRFNKVPSVDKPEALLIEWANGVDEELVWTVTRPEQIDRDGKPTVIHVRAEYTAEQLVARWTQQIREFFDPPRKAEITAACIECGERWVYRHRDGETLRSTALVFIRDSATGETTGAQCQSCDTRWAPDKFMQLAQRISMSEAAARMEE